MNDSYIPISGTINLRDFGGYPTHEGRSVQRGRLFRSGHMADMNDHGLAEFAGLDIETICDLRRPEERAQEPTPVPMAHARRVEIEIDPGSAIAMRAALADADLRIEDRISYMVEINRELARDHAEDYARMFEALMSTDRGFLVHCAAGKDRTGFGCALILHALGVNRETIVDDYLATNNHVDIEGHVIPRLQKWYGPDRPLPDHDTIMALAGVRPEYLNAALSVVDEEFDGMDAYLARTVGLDDNAKRTLRQRLTTPT